MAGAHDHQPARGPSRPDPRQRRGGGVRRCARRACTSPTARSSAASCSSTDALDARPRRRHRPARDARRGRRPRRRGRGRAGEVLAPSVGPRRGHPVHRRRHRLRDRLAARCAVGRRARLGSRRCPRDLPMTASGVPRPSTCPSSCSTPPARRCTAAAATWCPCWPTTTPGPSSRTAGRCPTPTWPVLLQTLSRETRGRLRALVAHVGDGAARGRRRRLVAAARRRLARPRDPHRRRSPTYQLVRLRAVEPSDLAGALAPVIAEVTA